MATYVPRKIRFYPDAEIRVSRSDDRANMPYAGEWIAVVGDGTRAGAAFSYGATREEAIAKLKARMRPPS